MPKITVYDPIFNRQMITVKVGLAALIRLHSDGYYLAYYKEDNKRFQYYLIIRCSKCGYYYLFNAENKGSFRKFCPICSSQQ